jgi:tRNA nucleotidyltransferase/poly(A) polymerase
MTDPVPRAPGYVRWATRTLEEAGFETWAVGGAIRNTLLGIPSGDWDLATRAPPGVVRKLFPRTVPLGIEHGTVGVLTRDGILLEVTTFRKDIETFGRHAVVEYAETVQEDLSRRDFTVNAIAWHPLRGVFADPFGGRGDLKSGLLRTVGNPVERFAEDYLRVLRALRFSGRFGFKIHAETWAAIQAAKEELGILSPERVREELLKVLAEAPVPSRALSLYRFSGVLATLYPEIEEGARGRRPGFGEELWVHSLLLADALPRSRPPLRLAALFQGVGRSGEVGTDPGRPGLLPEEGARRREAVAALMVRLRFSNAEIREVSELAETGLEPPLHLEAPAEIRRWLWRVGPYHLPSLGRIWLAKSRLDEERWARSPGPVVGLLRRFRLEVHSGVPLRQADLAFDGRDLISMGLKPGPRFGEILDSLLDRVLENPSLNQKALLRDIVEEMLREEVEGCRS